MYFNYFLITCIVTLFLCHELQSQNVANDRNKRVPEKYIEEIHKLVRDYNNKQRRLTTPKPKENRFLASKSKEQPPLIQKSKENLSVPPKPVNNFLLALNPVASKPQDKLAQPRRAHLEDNLRPQVTISSRKGKLKPSLANTNGKEDITAGEHQREKEINLKESDRESKNVQKQTIPVSIHDASEENARNTIKPQITTQSQKTDSQIEKPITKPKNRTRTDVLLESIGKRKSAQSKLSENKVTPISSEEKHHDKETQRLHEPDASNRSSKVDMESTKKLITVESNHQLETPEILKTTDDATAEVIPEQTSKSGSGDARCMQNHDENNAVNVNTTLKIKDLKVYPISRSSKDPVFGESNNNTDGLLLQSADPEIIQNNKDDVNSLAKPLMNDLKNETIEVIKIKQQNFTEVVEDQPPMNDSNETYFPTTTSTWQEYATPEIRCEESYKPDVTYAPPPYEYPYSNQINIDNYYIKTNPYVNDYQARLKEEALKKRWRSWINTEVTIQTLNNRPHTIEIHTAPTRQIPVRNMNYNNINRGQMLASYPCYVYPNICYGSNAGYYA